jgi:flagellar biosynthetic protein FliR
MQISFTTVIAAAFLIGVRVSGVMWFAPFFGSVSIPPRIKVVLALAITAALYPVYSSRVPAISPSEWPVTIAREAIVGLATGLTTNLVFEAAQVAGQILSIQVGYSLVNLLDPNTQVDSTVMAVFHQTLAMIIFLALDVHHWMLRAVAHSFDYLPVGTATLNPLLVKALLHQGAVILEVSLQIAAPVLAATLLIDLVLGLLGKSSPQMPLMLLGPAIKSMLGVLLLQMTISRWPRLFEGFFFTSMTYTEQILHLAQ